MDYTNGPERLLGGVSVFDPGKMAAGGVPWNLWDVVRASGLIVAVSAVAVIVLAMVEPGPAVTVVVLVLPHSSMIAAVWLFGVRNRSGWRPVGFVAPPLPQGLMLPGLVLLASLGLGAIYVRTVTALGIDMLVPPRLPHEILAEGPVRLLSIAGVGIAGPLIEEAFFRGFLLAALVQPLGPFRAAVVASAVFSAAHASLAVVLPLFFVGLLLSWLYLRTGSLWPPFAAHAAQNLLALAATLALEET